MRKIVSVLALLLFLQVFCLPGRAEEGSWETLHQHALSLYQSGMFSEAVTEGLKALGEAEKTAGPDSPEAASTLGLLANA